MNLMHFCVDEEARLPLPWTPPPPLALTTTPIRLLLGVVCRVGVVSAAALIAGTVVDRVGVCRVGVVSAAALIAGASCKRRSSSWRSAGGAGEAGSAPPALLLLVLLLLVGFTHESRGSRSPNEGTSFFTTSLSSVATSLKTLFFALIAPFPPPPPPPPPPLNIFNTGRAFSSPSPSFSSPSEKIRFRFSI